MKKIVLLILICFSLTNSYAQKSDAVKWIVGTWKINTGQGFIVEKWKLKNDSTFTGTSYFVKAENDSALQETLELSFRKGEWTYTPTVTGQNNNSPVAFKIIFLGRAEFISENKAHDFPQRISYRRVKNQLFASIEGNSKGKYKKQNFDYVTD